jgi:hypothetical protein
MTGITSLDVRSPDCDRAGARPSPAHPRVTPATEGDS